jgi:glycosyltransferase involved in cell wall biosynthesis
VRIALVSDTYTPQINGVTTVLRRIMRALRDARHAVAIVAPAYPGGHPDAADELRLPSVALPPYPAIRLSLPAFGRVAEFLDRFAPDLVHVVTEGPLGVMGRRYAVRRHRPLVTSYHTHFPRYCRHYGVAALEPVVWRFLTWFHGAAVLTQTPGEQAQAELAAHGLSRALVWGRGVDTGHFHHERRDWRFRRRLGIADGDVAVLHVGRLAAEKNLDTLVHAWTTVRDSLGPRVRFVIAGDGPLGSRLSAAMPWAIRFGFLETRLLATLYASCDLCVLPSATETCGLVALEAMASGLPVVAADAGGFRESVAQGRTGFLVSPHDAVGFAGAIARLALNAPLRRRMSAEARLAAVARDSALEDAALFDQYRRALGLESERDVWRAAS